MKVIGIYKITSPSGKVYIGQSIDVNSRIKRYKYLRCKGQIKLYNSLKKYGYENHKFDIIEECSNEGLYIREIYWIEQYNSIQKGLNLRMGGEGKKHNNIKYTHSKEFLQELNKRLKNNKYNFGTVMSKKTKLKQSLAKNKVKRKIFCPELNQEFESIMECSRNLNINLGSLSGILRGHYKKTRNGLTFKYVNI